MSGFIQSALKSGGSWLSSVAEKIPKITDSSTFRRHIGREHLRLEGRPPLSERKITPASSQKSYFQEQVHEVWLSKQKGKKGGGQDKKDNLPRYILSSLMQEEPTQLQEVNDLILSMEPWSNMGTGWIGHDGGYDFTATTLTAALHLAGSRGGTGVLTPEAENHMMEVLLNFDKLAEDIGKLPKGSFDLACPNSGGLVEESENHTWMILSCVLLSHKYKVASGDNSEKTKEVIQDIEERLLSFIDYTKQAGFHEFNARPYVAYTITPLLNLEAFGSEDVSKGARDLLDYMNYCYALSSLEFKRFPPFCRLLSKADETPFDLCHHTAFWKAWAETGEPESFSKGGGIKHAVTAVSLPYRPSPVVTDLISNKGEGYLAFIGHGSKASPEIYYAGKNFLLSAGGVKPPSCDPDIVVRPTTLILPGPECNDLSETLSLGIVGDKCQNINSTGVYRNFACSRGGFRQSPNHKKMHQVDVENGKWKIYEVNPGTYCVAYNTNKGQKDLGIMAFFEREDFSSEQVGELLNEVVASNSNEVSLSSEFNFPEGTKLTYDVDARSDQWVMESEELEGIVNVFDRDFGNCPTLRHLPNEALSKIGEGESV
jgi:hypothetical protein